MGGKGGKGSHKACVICGITDRKINDSEFFVKFPLNENRCREWLRAAGKEQLVQLPVVKLRQFKYVCSGHFNPEDIITSARRIRNHAIPTLNLKGRPLTDAQLAPFPQPLRQKIERTTPRKGQGAGPSVNNRPEPLPEQDNLEDLPPCARRLVSFSEATSTFNLNTTDLTPLLGDLIEKLKQAEPIVNPVSKIDAPLLKQMLQAGVEDIWF